MQAAFLRNPRVHFCYALRRILALFRRNHLERDLDDELAFHLAMRREEEVSGASTTKEVESVLQDVRFVLRGLVKNRGFTTVTVLTLAGIGANTAIFSVINGVLLKRLSYEGADRFVQLIERDRGR